MDPRTRELVTVDKLEIDPALRQLFGYLVERRCIVQLTTSTGVPPHLLARRAQQDRREEHGVGADGAPEVAQAIKSRGLFGYN